MPWPSGQLPPFPYPLDQWEIRKGHSWVERAGIVWVLERGCQLNLSDEEMPLMLWIEHDKEGIGFSPGGGKIATRIPWSWLRDPSKIPVNP